MADEKPLERYVDIDGYQSDVLSYDDLKPDEVLNVVFESYTTPQMTCAQMKGKYKRLVRAKPKGWDTAKATIERGWKNKQVVINRTSGKGLLAAFGEPPAWIGKKVQIKRALFNSKKGILVTPAE